MVDSAPLEDRFVQVYRNGKSFLICKQKDLLKITSIPYIFHYRGIVTGGPIEYSFIVF